MVQQYNSLRSKRPVNVPSGGINEELGRRLKALRAESGMTQADVAKELSISAQQYQKYEKGTTKCSLSTVYSLASFYNRPISDFLPSVTNDVPATDVDVEESPLNVDGVDFETEAEAMAMILAAFMRVPSVATRRKLLGILDNIL